jgi:hypothetical protein
VYTYRQAGQMVYLDAEPVHSGQECGERAREWQSSGSVATSRLSSCSLRSCLAPTWPTPPSPTGVTNTSNTWLDLSQAFLPMLRVRGGADKCEVALRSAVRRVTPDEHCGRTQATERVQRSEWPATAVPQFFLHFQDPTTTFARRMASLSPDTSADVEHGWTKSEPQNAAPHAEASAHAEAHHHKLGEWYVPGTDTANHAWVEGSNAMSAFCVRFTGRNRWVSWTASLRNMFFNCRTSACFEFSPYVELTSCLALNLLWVVIPIAWASHFTEAFHTKDPNITFARASHPTLSLLFHWLFIFTQYALSRSFPLSKTSTSSASKCSTISAFTSASCLQLHSRSKSSPPVYSRGG